MTAGVRRTAASMFAALALLMSLSGCGWRGLNSLPLPGVKGNGPGSYTVQAEMPDLTSIQRNSRVRVGDENVGTITNIELKGWHALVTMTIDGDVVLPENATAKLGISSLLGSSHIELATPKDVAPEGRLHSGSLIPLSRASSYPTVEQTLASVSLLLNGGGVGQLQDIVQAFATAFRGREQETRSLIEQLDTFIGSVDRQTGDIIAANESLNRVVGKFADQKPVLDRALKTIPDALAVLKDERTNLAEALDQLGKFSAVAANSINLTKENLVKELHELPPVLKALADAGPAMTRSFSGLATYPFPLETLDNWFRGDYGNLSAVFDLTLSRLDGALLTGTRFEGDLTQLEMQWGRTMGVQPSPYTSGNPLVAPYHLDQGK
jgi:phospholipid/cholesterol/gamma-HCH transport system substrate-binding protein